MTIGFKVCGKISKRGKHPFCHIETRLKFLTMLWEVNSRTFKDTFLKICFFPGISRIFKEISKIQGSSRKFKNVATMILFTPIIIIRIAPSRKIENGRSAKKCSRECRAREKKIDRTRKNIRSTIKTRKRSSGRHDCGSKPRTRSRARSKTKP